MSDFYLKKNKKCFRKKGYDIVDYGCYSEESVDYPDFAQTSKRHN